MQMEAEFSKLCLEDNKISYPNSEIHKASLDFSRLSISNRTKPLKDLQNQRPSVRTEPTALIELAESCGSFKNSIVNQPIDRIPCGKRSVLDQGQDHICKTQPKYDKMKQKIKDRPRPRLEYKKGRLKMQNLKIKKSKNVFTGKESTRTIQLDRSLTAPSERVAISALCNLINIRRRSGKVQLSNILKNIVYNLRKHLISHLFVKPVTEKEAPDYFDIVKRQMDLSIIRSKVRKRKYNNSSEFRFDVWQMTNSAKYNNNGRNARVPRLADQLLAWCDRLLEKYKIELKQAEAEII